MVLEQAVQMVFSYRAHVQMDLVYCIDGETSKADMLRHGDATTADVKRKEMFAESLSYLAAQQMSSQSIFLHGASAKTILNYVKEHPYDCVVVGSRGRNEWQMLVLGSVSHKLAKYVEVPLLIVK
ncbi:universal stress protein [Shouchella lonarensis]|nr:universal stress protein [Shouchella lonarensis]